MQKKRKREESRYAGKSTVQRSTCSGLGRLELVPVIHTVKEGTLGEMAAWKCPFCRDELAAGTNEWQEAISKRLHLKKVP
jgi:hypothetical protein